MSEFKSAALESSLKHLESLMREKDGIPEGKWKSVNEREIHAKIKKVQSDIDKLREWEKWASK